MKRKRRSKTFRGTQTEHAVSAQKWFDSARNNYRRQTGYREDRPVAGACGGIEHMTDVVAEATVAMVEADSAGDDHLSQNAERLVREATHKQREFTEMCRRHAILHARRETNLRTKKRRRGR